MVCRGCNSKRVQCIAVATIGLESWYLCGRCATAEVKRRPRRAIISELPLDEMDGVIAAYLRGDDAYAMSSLGV